MGTMCNEKCFAKIKDALLSGKRIVDRWDKDYEPTDWYKVSIKSKKKSKKK